MNITAGFILLMVALIAIFDVFIIAKKGKRESISAHIIRGSKKYPLPVLLFGVVLGHLFWPMNTADIYYNTKCITEKVESGDVQKN